jgi:hypothetical protein
MAPVIPAAIFTQIALKKKLGPDDREDFSQEGQSRSWRAPAFAA